MSEDQTQPETTEDETPNDIPRPDELSMLKQRARMMGITFSNNIGLDALKDKIREKQEGGTGSDELPKTDELEEQAPPAMLDPSLPPPKKKETLRQQVIRENMRLVRIRIQNLDPKKKDLPGEVLTVANKFLGTVRKFIPYGEVTEDGYHVPYCLYKVLKSRKFLNIRTYKDRRNSNQIKVEQNWVPEFSIEILPALDQNDLRRLAASQAAAGGVD